jgi:manganese-dependent ADP-ribose/CDP-alcohol diphosphatase
VQGGARKNLAVHHVIGNHCLDAGRSTLMHRLEIPEPGYFTRKLPHNWRLVVLDTTEISGKSDYSIDSWQYKEAREYENAHPLSESEPQMSPWNGGISKNQMQWLKNELKTAEGAGERIIVGCHHQIGSGAARPTHMAWNWKEIERVCVDSPSVCLVLAGHDHVGGYAEMGPTGKKHAVTVEGLLEAPTDGNAYAVLKFFNDRLEIEGFGTVTSRKLSI